jgi:glycosyltransferase involved in cell wall biosynthesis
LRRFNGIDSEVLYPPLFQPERFHCNPANNEIVCIARVEQHKRQLLLVEAMRFTHSDVRLRICGSSTNGDYAWQLRTTIRSAGLSDRVTFDERWISEAEKVEILADSLAAAYLPLDEDSYGYSSLEAAHSRKAVLTTTDSGGVLELVQDMVSGFVVPPDPQAIGDAMDRLFLDKGRTRTMGENARTRVDELEISWPHVLERLLA